MEDRPIKMLCAGLVHRSSVAEDLFQDTAVGDPAPHAEPQRKSLARPQTIPVGRISQREQARLRVVYPDVDHPRPATRADCLQGEFAQRPCPFVSCKHHLFLDTNPSNGNIKLNFPTLEVDELPESCALDIADRGGSTLEEVGASMNLTRERVRQIEARVLARLLAIEELTAIWEDWGD